MSNVQLVVFDMAGTTVKDDGNIAEAFINAMKQYGFEITQDDANKVMGFKKTEAIEMMLNRFYPGVMDRYPDIVNKIHLAFIEGMSDYYTNVPSLEPLPHAQEIFKWLHERGIKVALNTGFYKDITNIILRRLNWIYTGVIDEVISSDEVDEGRPHTDMIVELMKRTNVKDASSVVKVGDTEVDIQEGRNAGCGKVISVTTGAYSLQELQKLNPDHIISSLNEIKALIA